MKKIDKKEFSKDELKRYIGSLSEKYHDDIKTIKEGVKYLLVSSAKHGKILESHSDQMARLTIDTTTVKSDIKELRANMMEVRHNLTQLKLDVKIDLERKIDKNLFVDLDSRIRNLENK